MVIVLAANIFAAVSRLRDFHEAMGWTLLVLVIVHLLLHYRQILAMVKSFFQ
jgi:uncharacterized membrane protein YhaH (DUF805 family)